MNLGGKVIVITGASRGLGRALADVFSKEGALVVLSGNEKRELIHAAHAMHGFPLYTDVRKESDVKLLARTAVRKFGKIDIWVNNAGVGGHHAPIETQDPKFARLIMDVNFFGTFFGSRAALSVMKKQKSGGVIVNILSVRALTPHPLSSVYSASKAAAKNLTDGLRKSAVEHRIEVFGVYPAGMRTEFHRKKPKGYASYLDPHAVAGKIVANLKRKHPSRDLVIHLS